MSPEMIAAAVSGSLVLIVLFVVVYRRVPKRLKVPSFLDKWKQIQGYCKDKDQWTQALIEADALLDRALKRRKFKGKSMGERMVSAQRIFTNNDGVWFAHNLFKKVSNDPGLRLKEADMKAALIGFRQALRDLGALTLPDEQPKKGETQ
jgi:hypothetical protein